jgi:hypothetical protein
MAKSDLKLTYPASIRRMQTDYHPEEITNFPHRRENIDDVVVVGAMEGRSYSKISGSPPIYRN